MISVIENVHDRATVGPSVAAGILLESLAKSDGVVYNNGLVVSMVSAGSTNLAEWYSRRDYNQSLQNVSKLQLDYR